MGAIDKFLNNLNLGSGNSDSDDYYDDYDDEEEVEQPRKFSKSKSEEEKSAGKFTKVTSIGNKKKSASNVSYEINVVKPTTMEDSKLITNSLLDNMAVLLNLTNVDIDLARRVLDFAMGTTYALNGTLQKITDSIFVIVPDGVDISGALSSEEED